MIVRILEENYLERFMDQDGVTIAMSVFKCQYVMSKPTGFTNQALPVKYLLPKTNIRINKDKLKLSEPAKK